MDTTLNVAYGAQISAAATRHNLDPRLLAAVAAQETGGPGSDSGRNVVGDGGHGHGLFQIDDRWHPFASSSAAMDPAANADYAAGMLQSNLQRYGGNVHEALSAYNTGSPTATGTTTTWGDGTTLGYADSVLRHYADLGATPATASGSAASSNGAAVWDPQESAGSVGALRGLLQLLGGAGSSGAGGSAATSAGASSAASGGGIGSLLSSLLGGSSSSSAPSIGMPQLPQYKPLQQTDGTERDIAPSELLGTDDE